MNHIDAPLHITADIRLRFTSLKCSANPRTSYVRKTLAHNTLRLRCAVLRTPHTYCELTSSGITVFLVFCGSLLGSYKLKRTVTNTRISAMKPG